MQEFDHSGRTGRTSAKRFDGASVPAPRTDEIRHVTLESLLNRVDEALDAIASLDRIDDLGLSDSLDLDGAGPPEPSPPGK